MIEVIFHLLSVPIDQNDALSLFARSFHLLGLHPHWGVTRRIRRTDKKLGSGDDSLNTFFSETGAGKSAPRVVSVDLKLSVVKEMLSTTTLMVTTKVGKGIVALVLERIRKLTNQCTCFEENLSIVLFMGALE